MSINSIMREFAGRTVHAFKLDTPLPDPNTTAIRLETLSTHQKKTDRRGNVTFEYETTAFEEVFDRFLQTPGRADVQALIIGPWSDALYKDDTSTPAARLIEHADKLPRLEALFIADLTYEMNELSWIKNSDLGPLVRAFPHLTTFGTRGGDGLRLSNLRHDKLQHLTIETGGLSGACARDIAAAILPNLTHLDLWLGTEDYGCSTTPDDLAPILSGKLFPRLSHLGLQNYWLANNLATAIAAAPVLAQLTALDLSMGTMTDRGAAPLLGNPSLRHLKLLDLSSNFITEDLGAQLQASLPDVEVDTATTKFEDYDWNPEDEEDEEDEGYMNRYVTHGE